MTMNQNALCAMVYGTCGTQVNEIFFVVPSCAWKIGRIVRALFPSIFVVVRFLVSCSRLGQRTKTLKFMVTSLLCVMDSLEFRTKETHKMMQKIRRVNVRDTAWLMKPTEIRNKLLRYPVERNFVCSCRAKYARNIAFKTLNGFLLFWEFSLCFFV